MTYTETVSTKFGQPKKLISSQRLLLFERTVAFTRAVNSPLQSLSSELMQIRENSRRYLVHRAFSKTHFSIKFRSNLPVLLVLIDGKSTLLMTVYRWKISNQFWICRSSWVPRFGYPEVRPAGPWYSCGNMNRMELKIGSRIAHTIIAAKWAQICFPLRSRSSSQSFESAEP